MSEPGATDATGGGAMMYFTGTSWVPWCDCGPSTGTVNREENAFRLMRSLVGTTVNLPIMRPQGGTAYLTAWIDHWVKGVATLGIPFWGLHYRQDTPQPTNPGDTAFYLPSTAATEGHLHSFWVNREMMLGDPNLRYEPLFPSPPHTFKVDYDIGIRHSFEWFIGGGIEQMIGRNANLRVDNPGGVDDGRRFHNIRVYKYTDSWADIGGTGFRGQPFEVYGFHGPSQSSGGVFVDSEDFLRGKIVNSRYQVKDGVYEQDLFVDPLASDLRWWYQTDVPGE